MAKEARLFAVVSVATGKVVTDTGSPFDAKDLESAYVEAALTYVKDFDKVPTCIGTAAVAKVSLETMGAKVVPLTPELEKQYPTSDEGEKTEEKIPKSRIKFSASDFYVSMIRCIQVMPVFDTIGISVILNCPFGTISGRLAEICAEGYLLKVKDESGKILKAKYSRNELLRNLDLVGRPINYGKPKSGFSTSEQYRKNEKRWGEFMTRWRGFLLGERVKGKYPAKKWTAGKGWELATYADGKWVFSAK